MAPKASKRQVASSTAGNKRSRNEIGLRCVEVVKAVRDADTGLPADVISMLASSAEPALRDFKESRGEHQEVVINWLSSALDSASAKLSEKITEARAGLGRCQEELAGHDSAVKDAEDKLDKLNSTLVDTSAAREEAEESYLASQQVLTDAQNTQSDGDSKVNAVNEKKQKLEALSAGEFSELKATLGSKKSIEGLVKSLKSVKADPALLTSLSASLAKAATDRTEFDQMVITQTDEFLATSIAELGVQIDADAEDASKRVAAVTEASANAESFKQQLDAAVASVNEATAAVKEGGRVLREAKKTRKDFMPTLDTAKALETAALEALQCFSDGPVASFNFLRERTAPAPEVLSMPVDERTAPAPEVLSMPVDASSAKDDGSSAVTAEGETKLGDNQAVSPSQAAEKCDSLSATEPLEVSEVVAESAPGKAESCASPVAVDSAMPMADAVLAA